MCCLAHREPLRAVGKNAMNRILTILLLSAYCYLAAFTTVEGEAGVGVTGRVIEADFLMLGLFVPAFLLAGRIRMAPNFWFYLAFMGAMLLSLILAQDPGDGVVEYTVHLFNFAAGVAIFNLCVNARDFSLSDAIYAFFYAVGAVSVLCLLQFFVFPGWFGGRQTGGLVGTFRNTGQSGTYFGTALALFVPAMTTRLIARNPVNLFLLLLMVMCLVLTVKRAALLGLLVGVIGMMATAVFTGSLEDRRRNITFFVIALIAAPLGLQGYDYATENVQGLENRMERKVENFSTDEFLEKFFGENAGSALRAFEDEPLVGVGPGNIIGDYTEKYEIHSTPLSILSSTGLLGFTLYLAFLFHWLVTIFRAGTGPLLEHRFLRLMFPMVIGLIVSWGYTYHVRKREFWIVYGIVMFGCWLVSSYRANSTEQLAAARPTSTPEQDFPRPGFLAERRG